MKVGILTHHWLGNFGANLQALATLKTLESMGHEGVFLDYRVPEIVERYAARIPPAQIGMHESFTRKYLPQSERCETLPEVIEVAGKLGLDCMLSGSDAVLRLDSKTGRDDLVFPNPFWLDWTAEAKIRRSAFIAASSMGSNFLDEPAETRKGIGLAIRKLDYCGIRDDWTRLMLRICSPARGVSRFCPDPTSNFPEAVPAALLPDIDTPSKPYLLVGLYPGIVSPEWQASLTQLAHDHGMVTVGLPQPDVPADGHFDINLSLPLSPLDWYQWIVCSAGYVGVRFHPIMIAVSRGVPVVALDDYDNEKFLGQKGFRKLRKFRRHLGDIPRKVSKTYDLLSRVGKQQYAVPARRFSTITPEEVITMIQSQRERPTPAATARKLAARFRDGIHQSLGTR